MRYLRPYRWQAALALLCLMASAGLALVNPLLTERALDVAVPQRDFGMLRTLALIALGALLLEFVLEYVQALVTTYIGQRVMRDLRLQIFEHMQRLSIPYFDRNPVGRLMTRVTSDVETLNELFSSGVVTVFGDLFTLAAIMVLMLVADWRLALVAFAVIPFVYLLARVFRRRVREAFRDIRLLLARLNSYLQEHLSGMRVVQLFAREPASAREYGGINEEHLQAHLRSVTIYALFFPAIEILTAIALALVLWYGGLRTLGGTLTIGVLAAFIQLTRRFFQPLQDLSEKFNLLQAAMASSERIFRLLNEPVTVTEAESPRKLPEPVRGEVRFESVWFRYSDSGPWVLSDVSFTARPGETVALVGHTGAGKTTIISLLLRFYEPTRGRITVDGVDIRELSFRDLRGLVGYVQQDLFLFTGRHPSQPRPRRAAHRGRDSPGGGAGGGRPLRAPPARRVPARARRTGPFPQRRGAAAAEFCTRPGARSVYPHPGRGDQFRGRRGGGADPAGGRGTDGRTHQHRRGTPVEHHPARRPDPGPAPWGDPGARHAPCPAGGGWAVCAACTGCSSARNRSGAPHEGPGAPAANPNLLARLWHVGYNCRTHMTLQHPA